MTDAKTIIEQLLERRTPATFRAGGPSMNPTIRDGESVRIRPLRAGDPLPGAVALYRKHDRLILHRLLRRALSHWRPADHAHAPAGRP